MKKYFKIFILFFSINTSLLAVSEKVEAQAVSFQVFYDDLSPYGSWFQSPDYGYVWRPTMAGFSPYSTGGYWMLTDAGWTWVSDYSWGWAPFHYGRWYNDPFNGYVWVPGYEWGPGWVSWRHSNDYYGWAPIGPGVSLNVAYGNGYNVPYNNWNFVQCNNFGRRDIRNYYVDRTKNVTIINNTTVINNTRVDNTRKTTFNVGPDRMEVQKKSGRTYAPVTIVDEKKPTQRVTKNSVQLYRPDVKETGTAGVKPVPAKVIPIEDLKKVNTYNPGKKEAMEDRRSKQIPLQKAEDMPSNDKPTVNQPADQPQKQPVKQQPVRDENEKPSVKEPPVLIQQEDKKDLEVQPDRGQQPVRTQREPQTSQQEAPQQQPELQQQPVKQAPVMQQKIENPAQQPIREPQVQKPARQQPQQRVQPAQRTQPQQRQQPQQRVQPVQRTQPQQRQQPQQRVQPAQRTQPQQRQQPQQRVQQPMRQPPVQRAPAPQGGGRRPV